MLSRIFWIGLAGFALVAGLLVQNELVFSTGDASPDQVIEARIEDSIERRISDRMTIVTEDDRRIEIPRETKQAMAEAITTLISAEARVALLRARHADRGEIAAAEARGDAARGEIERLRAEIDRHHQLTVSQRDALRTQIRQEIRESVRESLRH